MPTEKTVAGWRLAAVAWAGAILYLSVAPADVPGAEIPYLDKAVHTFEYFVLAWLMVKALAGTQLSRGGLWTAAWASATGYGLALEGVQRLLAWRSGDWTDASANAAGAAMGVLLHALASRRVKSGSR